MQLLNSDVHFGRLQNNLVIHFNLSTVTADPLCSNLLLYEVTKQGKLDILILGILTLAPLHSVVSLFTGFPAGYEK